MRELRRLLENVTDALPPIVPEDMGFEEYFEKIWGTDQLNNAVTYGYFQLNSVRKAMEKGADLSAVLERYLGNDRSASRQGDGQRQNQRRGRSQGQPKQHAAPQNQKQAQPKAAPQSGEGKAAANHKRRYRPHHRRGKFGGGQPPQA